MHKHDKTGKRILICFSALFLILSLSGTAFAISGTVSQVISPGSMREWDNGAKVTKTHSGTGRDYRLSVQSDTSGLTKGYYSVYLYDLTSRAIRSDDGISFYFKNENDTAMKISLTMVVNSKTSVSLTDASYVLLESADRSLIESVAPSSGTVSIPADFEGTVYVPFSRLYTFDGLSVPLTRIQSWGITVVMTENQQLRFQLGDVTLLSGSLASMKGSYYLISMTGDNSVTVPNVGAATESFQVQAKDLDGNPVNEAPVFYLKSKTAGVTLSEDGTLQVTAGCEASGVTVCAKLPDSVNFAQTEVTFKKISTGGWAGVPSPSSVEKLTLPIYTRLNHTAGLIRALAAVTVLILTVIFCRWLYEGQLSYRRIRDKLYHNGHGGEI